MVVQLSTGSFPTVHSGPPGGDDQFVFTEAVTEPVGSPHVMLTVQTSVASAQPLPSGSAQKRTVWMPAEAGTSRTW